MLWEGYFQQQGHTERHLKKTLFQGETRKQLTFQFNFDPKYTTSTTLESLRGWLIVFECPLAAARPKHSLMLPNQSDGASEDLAGGTEQTAQI